MGNVGEVRRVLVAAAIAALAAAAGALTPPAHADGTTPVTWTTVSKLYGPKPILQKLTAYVPSTPRPHPAILFIHGGCWARGSLSPDEQQVVKEIAKRTQYVVAQMTYRVDAPKYQVQPADVAAALHLLQTDASFGVDPARVVVWGESAGGQLGQLIAYRGTGAPGVGRPAAVVSVSGPADMRTEYAAGVTDCVADFEGGAPNSGVMLRRYKSTSPVSAIDDTDPPTFIANSIGDRSVPYNQAQQLNDALQMHNVAHQLASVPGSHHATPVEYDTPFGANDTVLGLAAGFLAAQFTTAPPA